MKVAKTLIESMPGKGDFHAEEMREWSSVSPSAVPYQQDGPGLSGIYGISDYDRFGISSVRKDILFRISMSSFLNSL